MDKRIIIIVVIVLILIIAYTFSVGGGKKQTGSNPGKPVNGTTSITVPPYITTYNSSSSKNFSNITGVNIKTIYSGPAVKGGVSCLDMSRAYTLPNRWRLGPNANFSFYFTVYSQYCNVTITQMSVDNNGFSVIDVQPPLPYLLPADSQIQVADKLKTPNYNFTGPLSITVYEK